MTKEYTYNKYYSVVPKFNNNNADSEQFTKSNFTQSGGEGGGGEDL